MGKHTGKKRWRKNDISDIQSALTSKNILQEHLGTSVDKLHSLPSESLFVIDKTSKEKPKTRTKDYYRNKKLSYQVELEPSHIVAPKTLQNENVDKEKLAKQAIERAVQRIERKQELAQAAQPPKKKDLPKVYDIWETAPEPRKEIVARPYPQKIIRRKPSELPAVEIPTTDVSYNPSEASINAVNQTLQKIEKKVRARTSKLDKLIRPQRARSLTELEKTIRLTTKQRLQVRKAIRKQVRTRSKPSKPGKKAVDPNYSMKMTRTQRNKLIKKKIRRKLLHKMLREEKRSKNLDKVEKIVSELDEKARRAQKRLLRRKLKEKLKIQMKRIKHKFFALPKTTATLSSASSLRSFKPAENMIHEKVLRYQERNILAV